MKTKPTARVFDVRVSTPKTNSRKLPDGSTSETTWMTNVHLVVVAETAGRANELALAAFPKGSVWQINHHGQASDSLVIVDESQLEPS